MTPERLAELAHRPTEERAYELGYDCGRHGPDSLNCDFRTFATVELKAIWEFARHCGEKDHATLDQQ